MVGVTKRLNLDEVWLEKLSQTVARSPLQFDAPQSKQELSPHPMPAEYW
jgi:hypothetical protein